MFIEYASEVDPRFGMVVVKFTLTLPRSFFSSLKERSYSVNSIFPRSWSSKVPTLCKSW